MYDIKNLKSWFADKFFATLSSTERYCLSISDEAPVVIKETEKAVQLQFVCDFGKKAFWFPKSVFMTKND